MANRNENRQKQNERQEPNDRNPQNVEFAEEFDAIPQNNNKQQNNNNNRTR